MAARPAAPRCPRGASPRESSEGRLAYNVVVVKLAFRLSASKSLSSTMVDVPGSSERFSWSPRFVCQTAQFTTAPLGNCARPRPSRGRRRSERFIGYGAGGSEAVRFEVSVASLAEIALMFAAAAEIAGPLLLARAAGQGSDFRLDRSVGGGHVGLQSGDCGVQIVDGSHDFGLQI